MTEDATPASFDAIRGLIAREIHEYGMPSVDAAKIAAAIPDTDIGRAVQGVLAGRPFGFALETFRNTQTGIATALSHVTDYKTHAKRPEGTIGASSLVISLEPIIAMALGWTGGARVH